MSSNFCLCPDGQYDDEISENCVNCDDSCNLCNISTCLQCKGDLVNDS